ncbi:MAG TPA: LPS-assembly protein LptD [Cellvibrio sp.]|nr:LPS-assembly protein LptD [Cellvibrio sp.]
MAPTKNRLKNNRHFSFIPSRLAYCIAAQCAGFLFSSLVYAGDASKPADPNDALRELDWIPMEELTEEQKKQVPTACCGAYIAPPRDDAESNLDPEKANIFGTADYSEAEKQTKFIMRSDVRLTQGRRSFRADTFTFDKATREAELKGNIQVREPGVLLRAERAYVDTNTGNAELEQARFVLYETRVRGRAEKLEKFGDQIISLDQGTFTSCEPGDNTWLIRGSNITLHNDKHYGTAKHMRLEVKDIPIAYAPYFRFPIGPDRLTGFLFPSIGLDSEDVIGEFTLPFYWNIAPNYDATFTWRYLSDHGNIISPEFRHMSRYFDSQLSGSFLSNDRGGYSERLQNQIDNDEISEADAYPYKGDDRWQYNLTQTGGRNEPWSTLIDYTDVSDTDYLRDIDRSAVDLNRQASIRQLVSSSYTTSHWQLGAKAEEFRLFSDTQLPYRVLPRINVDGEYRFNDWVLDLDNEYTHFAMNRYFSDNPAQAATEADLITGDRVRTSYGLTWDKEYAAGFIKPGVGVKTLGYELEAGNMRADVDSSPRVVTPQGSLDTGLYFERDKQWFGNDFVQTLEPRAFYLYRDYENQDEFYDLTTNGGLVNFDTSDLIFTYQQLFRDSRFSGGDRIDDTNHLALGLTSRFVESDSGIERLRLSIGQIHYYEDREISLPNKETYANIRSTSPLAGQVSAQLGDHLRLTNDVVYDHQTEKVQAVNSSLHYMDEQYRILNVGYRYTRDPVTLSPLDPTPQIGETLDQLDVTALWPINNQWAIIARTNYDFSYNAELDTFAGLEYTDCCYRVRVLARQWVDFDFSPNFLKNLDSDDYDRGVFFEVQLRGFGTLSQRISNLLDKAMLGFSEREASLK